MLAIWNVGQGQWVTLSDDHGCSHFDSGGEFLPSRQIMDLCRDRPNFIYLSHWDWDHVGLLGKARRMLPDICLGLPPQGQASERKKRLLAGLSRCEEKIPNFKYWENPKSARSANALSRVIVIRNILIPGDSTREQEKFWSRVLPLASVKLLVLGHHGSATSTGEDLLKHLPQVKMAVASARFRRYGHPHPQVLQSLRKKKISVLKTEDWGNLLFRL